LFGTKSGLLPSANKFFFIYSWIRKSLITDILRNPVIFNFTEIITDTLWTSPQDLAGCDFNRTPAVFMALIFATLLDQIKN